MNCCNSNPVPGQCWKWDLVSCFPHIGGNKWNCFLAHEQNITKFKRKKKKEKRVELFVTVILKYKIILNVFPFKEPMAVYINYITQKCKLCSQRKQVELTLAASWVLQSMGTEFCSEGFPLRCRRAKRGSWTLFLTIRQKVEIQNHDMTF